MESKQWDPVKIRSNETKWGALWLQKLNKHPNSAKEKVTGLDKRVSGRRSVGGQTEFTAQRKEQNAMEPGLSILYLGPGTGIKGKICQANSSLLTPPP